MNSKLKSIFTIILAVVTAALLAACDNIHEFPEPGTEEDPTVVETHITINCKIHLTGLSVVTKALASHISGMDFTDGDQYDRRYIIQVRSAGDVDTLVTSLILYRDVEDTEDLSVDLDLKTVKYRVAVWMDYVKKGSNTDLYYSTGNGATLTSIRQPSADKYVAGPDFKDAQYFLSEIDLTPYTGQWYADITIEAQLIRPVAKITLLANDLALFASNSNYKGDLKELADDLEFEISYEGYFPTGFNALTGKLNDAQGGYGFEADGLFPYTFEETEYTRVGTDFVFVNGSSSSVTVSVVIKSKKTGQTVNRVNKVVVPITAGEETVIIYNFITKGYVPGIGINPEFDGEFNIEV